MVTNQKKSVKVGKMVDTDHVNSVIRNYKQERWVHNSKRIGKEDSLSVWYSIEELEEFLSKAKEHGADGIKLYFGAYDEEHAPQPLYAGRQTIVLVGTKQCEGIHGETRKDVYVNTEAGISILAYNAGTLCPPICHSGDDFPGIGITIVDKGEDGFVVA